MNDLSLYSSTMRGAWRHRRARMEADGRRHTRSGVQPKRRGLIRLTALVEPVLAVLGLRSRGLANTLALEVSELDIPIAGLPEAFDGYRILHLSDLHVGRIVGLTERVAAAVREMAADLAVLTGDIQSWGTPSAAVAADEATALIDAIRARDGILGVLGNHDTHDLVDHFEARGVKMLINEHWTITRGDASLRFTGLDDVNYFYTADAEHALRVPSDAAVSVALVHSPELADIAAETGYALYLAGHTHGGQICLPGGRPLLTAIDHHRHLARGLWQYGEMVGYTSRGVGVARRARFNCPPEITLLRLRRG